jgi:Bacteriocin-protection, YdeI or OmpD-Associated/Domain of unknown function (DUF1905)
MYRFDFHFEGPIVEHDFGRMAYKAVFIPEEILAQLPLAQFPRLRIDAMVGGVLTNCGLMAAKRRRYILLSAAFMKQAGLKFGQQVDVQFRIADQNAVDVPDELEQAIRAHNALAELWDSLSPGKRRSFAYHVASATRSETREERVLEVIESLRDLRSTMLKQDL